MGPQSYCPLKDAERTQPPTLEILGNKGRSLIFQEFPILGCFSNNGGFHPHFTPNKKGIFCRKKTIVVGETHHLREPPIYLEPGVDRLVSLPDILAPTGSQRFQIFFWELEDQSGGWVSPLFFGYFDTANLWEEEFHEPHFDEHVGAKTTQIVG